LFSLGSASLRTGEERSAAALIGLGEDETMGELLDALNALDDRGPPAEPVNPFDQAAQAFRSASERVNQAIQEPGMPLDTLSRWTRKAPLQALAVAFLVGVLFTRRRTRVR
jgi:hypothetical protein